MSLIKNNAKVAGQIAVAMESISDESGLENTAKEYSENAVPLVIGGSILDVHYRVHDNDLKVSSFLSVSESENGIDLIHNSR
jgi:hypothetical protein